MGLKDIATICTGCLKVIPLAGVINPPTCFPGSYLFSKLNSISFLLFCQLPDRFPTHFFLKGRIDFFFNLFQWMLTDPVFMLQNV